MLLKCELGQRVCHQTEKKKVVDLKIFCRLEIHKLRVGVCLKKLRGVGGAARARVFAAQERQRRAQRQSEHVPQRPHAAALQVAAIRRRYSPQRAIEQQVYTHNNYICIVF